MNTYTTLRIIGKLAEFVVRERDLTVLFNLCGEAINLESAQTFWRKVCTFDNPTEITGWVSIDHPEYLQEDSYDECFLSSQAARGDVGVRTWLWAGMSKHCGAVHCVSCTLSFREDRGGRFKG